MSSLVLERREGGLMDNFFEKRRALLLVITEIVACPKEG